MKFTEALEKLKEGKKIRDKDWYTIPYIYAVDGKILTVGCHGKPEEYNLSIFDIESLDWEVVDDWCLKGFEFKMNDITPVVKWQKVEVLKQKILEDIAKHSAPYYSNNGIRKIDEEKVVDIISRRFGF